MRKRAAPSKAALLPAALLGLLVIFACVEEAGNGPVSEGQLLVDSAVVIDQFHFSRAACDEVLPDAFANSDSVPAGTAASLAVTSIACYAVGVRVEDSLGRQVRSFERYFDIPGRQDGDKERGALGHIPWDGRDQAGDPVPKGAYLWRMDFRFGAGRSIRFRADMRLE